MLDYVNQRRGGKRDSKVSGKTDILSLMLANPEVFTDDVIVDELLDFFAAAAETT